jgi:hypothetical protein
MTDNELLEQFEKCTLPNSAFHHEDHLRLTFLYLCNYPVLEALRRFPTSLTRFAAANGRPGVYSETITWAFVLLIRERMARAGRQQVWGEFAASNPDLLNWKDNILKKYYQEETLASELAKVTFLFPDKLVPCFEKTH